MSKIEKYLKYNQEINRFNYISSVLYFDASTDCPLNGKAYSFQIQEYVQNKVLALKKSPKYLKLIDELAQELNLDNHYQKAIFKEKKELDKLNKLDAKKIEEHIQNANRAYMAWEEGRETLDYTNFLKEFEELLSYFDYYTKTLATKDVAGYDVLLKEYEESFNTKMYDEMFDAIEKEVVPLVKKILDLPKKKISLPSSYDVLKQVKLTEELRQILGYDNKRGCVRETIHPYTIYMTKDDTRITTSYDLHNVFSNIYSVMHEIGHALYQLNIDLKYENTILNRSVSYAFDESQSRFIENYIGRNYNFISFFKPKLEKLFPEFSQVSVDDLYAHVNEVSAGLIRVDADELTYPLHVLVRYKVEKMLFNNEIKASEVETTFADLFELYLGVRPQNMKEGCFQDVHWTSDFGYFPTYVLGSAIGAQLLNTLKKDLDFDNLLKKGNLKPILDWLKNNIHTYGAYYTTNELLNKVCHEEFNVSYYINYLKEKFSKIYNI